MIQVSIVFASQIEPNYYKIFDRLESVPEQQATTLNSRQLSPKEEEVL